MMMIIIINLSEVLNDSEATNTRKFIRSTIRMLMYGAQYRGFVYRRRSERYF
jgi:hypothetical protein